jgi:hypothetical protein
MAPTNSHRGYLRPALLVLLGFAALGLTLAMDYRFGKSLALDDDNQILMGAVFLGIDIIVVGLACVNGNLYRDGYWPLAIPLSAFIFLGALLAMSATVGFGGAQRLGKTEEAVTRLANERARAIAQNSETLALRNSTIAWAQKTAVSGPTRSIRNAAQEQITKLALQPLQTQEVPEASVSPDIQAKTLVETLRVLNVPITVDTVQVTLVLGVAIFLTLSQSICFGLASFFWPIRQKAIRVKMPAPLPTNVPTNVVPLFPVTERATEPAQPDRVPDHVMEVQISESHEDAALIAALKPDVEELRRMRSQVEDFLEDCTYSDPSKRLSAAELHGAYVDWAQQHDKEIFTSNRFGRICTSLNIARDESVKSRSIYVGLGIRGSSEEAAIADAA